PFATLAAGAQSPIFGAAGGVSERPTGPLIGRPPGIVGGHDASMEGIPPGARRALPEDLFPLYCDYLRDMQAQAFSNGWAALAASPSPQPQPAPLPRDAAWASETRGAQPAAAPGFRSASPSPAQPLHGAAPPLSPVAPANPRSDQMIFFQLRYQLE